LFEVESDIPQKYKKRPPLESDGLVLNV